MSAPAPASRPERSAAPRRAIDAAWVVASWLSAYGLFELFGSPEELVDPPQLGPYALAALPLAAASATLGAGLGLYRAGTPLFGVGVVARVLAVRAAELAALVAVVVALAGGLARAAGVLVVYSVLALTSVLGWRAWFQLLAPYGLDFSKVPRSRRYEVVVSVTDLSARQPAEVPQPRLPRAKPR